MEASRRRVAGELGYRVAAKTCIALRGGEEYGVRIFLIVGESSREVYHLMY